MRGVIHRYRLMRLWAIQTIDAWNALQRTGVLRANPNVIDDSMLAAYRWMVARMHERLGRSPEGCQFPIWAWYQWQGQNRCKPDLRSHAHLEKGSHGVRIEIEADETDVLLSDFELWHFVLNYWYLPESEAEGELFDAELATVGLDFYRTKPLPDLKYHRRIEESWFRIFDLEWSAVGMTSQKEGKAIQGVLWELRKEQVSDMKEFVAR